MVEDKKLQFAFRMVHIDNITHILKYGIVKANSPNANPNYMPIGDRLVIEKRNNRTLSSLQKIGEFIPFYFGPRSPMLYVIQHGYNGVKRIVTCQSCSNFNRRCLQYILLKEMKLSNLKIVESKETLQAISEGKVLINTINAHSFNVAQKDELFADALKNGDYLIPDGASILIACKWLKARSKPKERIAGWDLFIFEMQRLESKSAECRVKGLEIGENRDKLRVMFMGSSEKVLARIREQAAIDYPNLQVLTYSPPYKPEFSYEDNTAIIKAINDADPDLLWIGMTAPKQEKWTYQHWNELKIHCHVGTIGAVFDFYAGTARRAPLWWQNHFLEWLFRLHMEPRRMWRRYVLGIPLFIYNIYKEKYQS